VNVSTIYPGLTATSFMENMLQEVEAPAIPPIARFASSATVGRRIVQAVRFNVRDIYVAPEDIAAIAADAFMPLVSDWVMRTFMRPGRRPLEDVRFEALEEAGASQPQSPENPEPRT
jgi:hypothetical protein